jgi:hypothetical protein
MYLLKIWLVVRLKKITLHLKIHLKCLTIEFLLKTE